MLAQRKMTNIDSASVWGASRRDAICDPFWEDLERSTRYKAKYQIATSTWEGRLFAEVEKFFAYGAAVLRALFDWLRKLLASGFSPLLKCFAEAFSVVGGIFARARRLFFPAKVGGGSAAGGTFRKKQRAFASLMELARQHAPGIKERLREQVRSPEFWLGVVFGATTRITTKFEIVAAFATTPGLVTLAGFVACATAGVAAGAVTHLVRTGYRNSKAAPGKGKEKYTGKALFESAAIGLFGGMLGGYVMNAGAVLARAGSVAIGVGAGVAAGVLHASVNGFRAAALGQKA
ncbi:MAG: hypothetical protein HGA90_04295, partial [Alphaproteobacteria bacterium]|nr:hypothetical protein [Alphaproteobacteria bacterium]